MVDHGSTDTTQEVVAQWMDSVTYLRREFDSGPQFSWLDGERLASHGRVKTLHHDDGLELTSMERCLALMEPDVGFIFTIAMLSGPKKINVLFDNVFQRSGVFESRKDRRIVAKTMISPTALLVRKQELIDEIYADREPFQAKSLRGAGADHFLKLLPCRATKSSVTSVIPWRTSAPTPGPSKSKQFLLVKRHHLPRSALKYPVTTHF